MTPSISSSTPNVFCFNHDIEYLYSDINIQFCSVLFCAYVHFGAWKHLYNRHDNIYSGKNSRIWQQVSKTHSIVSISRIDLSGLLMDLTVTVMLCFDAGGDLHSGNLKTLFLSYKDWKHPHHFLSLDKGVFSSIKTKIKSWV